LWNLQVNQGRNISAIIQIAASLSWTDHRPEDACAIPGMLSGLPLFAS
jgi:hypothetical protein